MIKVQVREVSGKIRALISAMAPLFSAQLVLFDPTIFGISAGFPSEIVTFNFLIIDL
jgi:hypothetical protein